MLLKAGIAMMSVALLMVAGVVAFVSLQREEPVAAATRVAEKTPEPTLRYGEPQRVPPEEPAEDVKVEDVKTEDVAPAPEPKPAPAPEIEPAPVSDSGPAPQPAPQSEVVQREVADWPAPTEEQIQAANEPRHYQLPPGAVMGLTMKAIGIYNAPVFDSGEAWALDAGVRHVPETSMPWSGGAQRNVYLEGHRLGYPGTGSHMVFYNLDKLGRGDEILLKDRDGRRYEYRVTDAFVVDPSESWVMGQIRGRDMVTLQTCTGPGYSQRLIVRADRV